MTYLNEQWESEAHRKEWEGFEEDLFYIVPAEIRCRLGENGMFALSRFVSHRTLTRRKEFSAVLDKNGMGPVRFPALEVHLSGNKYGELYNYGDVVSFSWSDTVRLFEFFYLLANVEELIFWVERLAIHQEIGNEHNLYGLTYEELDELSKDYRHLSFKRKSWIHLQLHKCREQGRVLGFSQ